MPTTGDLVHYFDRSMETPGPHEATVASAHEDPSVLSLTITAPGKVVHSDTLGSFHYEKEVPHAPGRNGRYWQTPEETAELSAQAEAQGEEQGPYYETEPGPDDDLQLLEKSPGPANG